VRNSKKSEISEHLYADDALIKYSDKIRNISMVRPAS